MVEISGLEERLDSAMTELLPALRATKVLNSTAMLDLLEVADGFGTLFRDAVVVPRALVGKLWFVFTAMLTEAEHCLPDSNPGRGMGLSRPTKEDLRTLLLTAAGRGPGTSLSGRRVFVNVTRRSHRLGTWRC